MFRMYLSYWKCHKARLLAVMFSLMLAMASIVFMIYWNRSASVARFEQILNNIGNYDYIIYDVTMESYAQVLADEKLDMVGCMTIHGTCSSDTDISFIAGSLDETGIMAYRAPVKSGHYPINEDEIAAEEKVFLQLGVAPVIGEQVELTLVDNENQVISTKIYTVSAILDSFTQDRQDSLLSIDAGNFQYPKVYFSNALNARGIHYLLACQNTSLTHEETMEYLSTLGYYRYHSWARASAEQVIAQSTAVTNRASVADNLDNAEPDYESRIVTPICTFIVILLAGICVYISANVVYRDRRQQFIIFRSVGLSKNRLLRMLIMEAVLITGIALLAGFLLGAGIYWTAVQCSGFVLEQKLPLAFQVVNVVEASTLNPYAYPAIACAICAFWSFFLSIRTVIIQDNLLEQPLGELDGRKSKPTKEKRFNQLMRHVLIKKKISSLCIFSGLLILMVTLYFGALYYSEKVEHDTFSLQYSINQMGAYGFDYYAQKDFSNSVCARAQINRQEITGIEASDVTGLIQMEEVDTYAFGIEVRGTRIVESGLRKEVEAAIGNVNLKATVQDYLKDLFIKSKLAQGYNEEDELYNVPTLGIDESQLSAFETHILSGAIDIDKLKQGEEIVLVVDNAETLCPCQVGDAIRLSDVVISDKTAAEFNFSRGGVPANEEPHFYYDYIREDGTIEKTAGYSFGTQVENEVTIGAIVTLDGHPLKDFYQVSPVTGQPIGIYIMTLSDAFQKWGLPDENITKLGISVKSDKEGELRTAWLYLMANSNEVNETRVIEAKEDIIEATKNQMLYLIVLMVMVCIMAVYVIYSSISFSIKTQMRKITQMRALGLPHRRVLGFYIREMLRYLGFASAVSWIPAFIFHKVYLYCREKYGGFMIHVVGEKKPWEWFFPMYDFSSQPYILYYVLTMVVIGLLLFGCVFGAVHKIRKYDISQVVKKETEY